MRSFKGCDTCFQLSQRGHRTIVLAVPPSGRHQIGQARETPGDGAGYGTL
jgi:hypothetical protein